MARMWEIREEHDRDHSPYEKYGYRSGYRGMSGRKDDSFYDGYDCGYEDGYRDAMKEAKRAYEDKR